MFKVLLFMNFILFLSGCMSLEAVRAKNRDNLMRLSAGMSMQEALSIMGKVSITAEGTQITQPYSSARVRLGGKDMDVVYYYTDLRQADDIITDDELTPLVFEDDRLIGWGRDFVK